MYNLNVKNLNQLALLGYNLQCMERPVVMALESYKKNSMLYILLFREIESMYFNGNLMEFIAEKVGITTKDIFVNKQDVKDYIKESVIQNKKMIFFSDHFWNTNYPTYYKKKHYGHPILFKAFNDINDEVVIIDEDLQHMGKGGDKYFFWPYAQKNIEFEIFNKICGNWISDEFKQENYLVCEFNVIDIKPISMESVLNDYEQMLKNIESNILKSEELFVNKFAHYILGDTLVNDYRQGNSRIYHHIKAVNRQCRFFSCLFEENKEIYDRLNKIGNELRQNYDSYYLFLLKNIENNKFDIMQNRLKTIFEIEKSFYGLLQKILSDKAMVMELFKKYVEQ